MVTNISRFVHPNQVKAWREVAHAIRGRAKNRVVLLAEPQVGKTGTMIWAALQRHKEALRADLRPLSIIAIADSNNALKAQTEADLVRALKKMGMMKYRNQFWVEHRSNIANLTLPNNLGMLTVFNDECHIAARKGGGRDKFQQMWQSFSGNKLLVDVGATSFAHIALHADQGADSPYDAVVKLQPGPSYNSIEHMYDEGRLQTVDPLYDDKGRPSNFLWGRINALKQHGGYTVIRAIGKRHAKVIDAIRQVSLEVPIIEADMFKSSEGGGKHITIAEIPTLLTDRPAQPTIILIRGALRVGIVIPPSASPNICEMIDTKAVRADTVAQSLMGRSCGYGKRDDKYRIYANLKHIETVLAFYQDVAGAVPPGLKNTGAKLTGTYQQVLAETAKVWLEDGTLDSMITCSANNVNDCADAVLRGVNVWQGRAVYLDGPNKNFGPSWVALTQRRPDLVGKYVTFNTEARGYSGAKVHENFIDLPDEDDDDE